MAVDPLKGPRPNPEIAERAMAAMNRLTKWRVLLTGWQLGTRSKQDPESQAVSDQRELLLLLRVEQSALVSLLIDKKIISPDEWAEQLREEADQLSASLSRRFPGVTANDSGLTFTDEAVETMKGWKR